MRDPCRRFCTRRSYQDFGEDGIRDREMFRGEAQALAFPIEEILRVERINLAMNCGEAGAGAVRVERGVIAFDAGQVDAVKLAQAEEEFFFQRLLRCDWLDLFAWGNSLLDHGSVLRGIVDVGPARLAVEGVRAGAEAQVRFALPVFQIVARAAVWERPVGNFVV